MIVSVVSHEPSRIAAETGGVTVLIIKAADRRDVMRSRTATTWN